MFKKILVPLDGSELAEAVLPYVYDIVECSQAQVLLLSVATNPAFEFAFADPAIAGRVAQDLENQIKTYMTNMETKLQSKGIQVTKQIVEGPVAGSILDIAQNNHVDLIAMSTHGRTGAARWVLGSVADKVVRNSAVPVLLIRPTHLKG